MRRALQYLRAALQLLTHLLLHLRQVTHRVAGLLAIHLLRCILELLHLCHQLWRQRLPHQRLRLAQLPGKGRVQRTRRLELLLELLRGLPELLHPLRHRTLFLRQAPRLLCRLEVHRALLLSARSRGILRGSGARLGPRCFVRLLRQCLLVARSGQCLLHGGIAECTGGGALLLTRRAAQHDLAAHAALRPWRCVHCFHAYSHRVACCEMQRGDVHRRDARPARAGAAGNHLRDGRRVAHTRAQDSQRDGRNAVVVRREHRELHGLSGDEQRIGAGLGDADARCGVGHDDHIERLGQVRHEAARSARRPVQLHRMIRRERAAERLTRGAKDDAIAGWCDQRHVGEGDRRAAGDRQHAAPREAERFADRERLVRPAEVAGIPDVQRDRADERTIRRVHGDAVTRDAAVGRDEPQVAAQGVHRPRCGARGRVDRQRVRPPCIAGLANVEVDDAAARRADAHPERRTAQQFVRHTVDAGTVEQAAGPRIDRAEYSAKSVAEQRSCREQHEHAGRRRSGTRHCAP